MQHADEIARLVKKVGLPKGRFMPKTDEFGEVVVGLLECLGDRFFGLYNHDWCLKNNFKKEALLLSHISVYLQYVDDNIVSEIITENSAFMEVLLRDVNNIIERTMSRTVLKTISNSNIQTYIDNCERMLNNWPDVESVTLTKQNQFKLVDEIGLCWYEQDGVSYEADEHGNITDEQTTV